MPVKEEEAAPPLLLEKADEDAPVTLRTEVAASCVAARRNIVASQVCAREKKEDFLLF